MAGRRRKLTDEEIAAAAVMWLAGARRKIICARFHDVDRETIRRNIKPIVNAAKSIVRQNDDSQNQQTAPMTKGNAA